jgi:hypothetical protein
VKLLGSPIINLQIIKPMITHKSGATHEIELPFLAACTLVVGFAAAVAVGLVSAMIVCF